MFSFLLIAVTSAAACPEKDRGTPEEWMCFGEEWAMRLTALLVLLFVSGTAVAQDKYGAIAYSNSTTAHAWAKDYSSRDAAEAAAIANCSKHANDCRAVLWFMNGCGALAMGKGGPGWGWGESQPLADSAALNTCSKQARACTVKVRVCTTR